MRYRQGYPLSLPLAAGLCALAVVATACSSGSNSATSPNTTASTPDETSSVPVQSDVGTTPAASVVSAKIGVPFSVTNDGATALMTINKVTENAKPTMGEGAGPGKQYIVVNVSIKATDGGPNGYDMNVNFGDSLQLVGGTVAPEANTIGFDTDFLAASSLTTGQQSAGDLVFLAPAGAHAEILQVLQSVGSLQVALP